MKELSYFLCIPLASREALRFFEMDYALVPKESLTEGIERDLQLHLSHLIRIRRSGGALRREDEMNDKDEITYDIGPLASLRIHIWW